jgi:hypothetical protein
MPKSPVSVMVSIVGSAAHDDETMAKPESTEPENSDDWLAERIAKIARTGIESLFTGNLPSCARAREKTVLGLIPRGAIFGARG